MKEIISLTLAVIFQSSDISVINMLGLVICMTGITLHVVRKATSVETRGSSVERSSRRGLRGSSGQKESLLSQSESEEDSEVEVFHTSRYWLSIIQTHFSRVKVAQRLQMAMFCPIGLAALRHLKRNHSCGITGSGPG